MAKVGVRGPVPPAFAASGLVVCVLSCAPLCAGQGANAPPADGPQTLLIGADWPYDAADAAKRRFHEAGFNFARITGGGYSWATRKHEQAVAELAARGVKVFLQLGSHYPSADYFRFRDSWFVDHKGVSGKEDRKVWAITYSGKAWPQYSYASKEIRPRMEKDFTAYLAAFKQHKNVAGIILHNEPGLFWLRERLFDYSPQAIRGFRGWLKRRYGTVDRLNAAWGGEYDSFDAVEPPRTLPPAANMAAWLDWRRAQVAMIREFLQWEVRVARRAWPGMPLTTNLAGPIEWWFQFRCADNFVHSEGFDVAGVDIYPSPWTTRHFSGYTMAMTRGVARDRPVCVLECEVYDGRKWPRLSPQQRAGLLRAEVWTVLGHGARGVCLWALDGRRNNCLTRGERNPRVAAMREVTHLCRMLRLGTYRSPARQVAVVVDPDSYLYYGGRRKQPPYFLDKAALGLYAAVVDAGRQADVLFAEQVRRGMATRYRVLLLAAQVMMDEALATRLREFVRAGGTLVAEAAFARVDTHGRELKTRPGLGLDKLFGVRVARTTPQGVKPIRVGDVEITGSMFRSDIEPAGAEVVGRFSDGKPAVTVREAGKGRAVYFASCVSVPYADGWGTWSRPGLRTFLNSLVATRLRGAEPVAVAHGGKAMLDTSVLVDGRGNRVLVMTVPPHKGKPEPAVEDVKITLTQEAADGLVGAYRFLPAERAGGQSRHGPEALEPVRDAAAGRVSFHVGTVGSAAVVLLARDAPVLLGLGGPAEVETEAEFAVTVRCVNPSAAPAAGTVDVVGPATCTKLTKPVRVRLERGQMRDVRFRLRAGRQAERLPIQATFAPEGGRGSAGPTVSVPIDVRVR